MMITDKWITNYIISWELPIKFAAEKTYSSQAIFANYTILCEYALIFILNIFIRICFKNQEVYMIMYILYVSRLLILTIKCIEYFTLTLIHPDTLMVDMLLIAVRSYRVVCSIAGSHCWPSLVTLVRCLCRHQPYNPLHQSFSCAINLTI